MENINKEALSIINASEEMEGFNFDSSNVSSDNAELMKNITPETVTAFINCEETNLSIVCLENGRYDLIAHNPIANETVKITGLGDHFVAFANAIKEAETVKREKNSNPNKNISILSNEFIKNVNKQILPNRCKYGEIGIGEYREIDYFGDPVEVIVTSEEEGKELKKVKCVDLETSKNGNVQKKMDELIDWTNNKAFKNKDKIMEDIAEFHARFIKIHPFRDGNGRTARILTNYLLSINNLPFINVPAEEKSEYIMAINYAIANSADSFVNENEKYADYYSEVFRKQGNRTDDNKYKPLVEIFQKFAVPNCNDIVTNILNYKDQKVAETFAAEQIK